MGVNDKMIKAITLYGGHRRHKNTEILTDMVLKGINGDAADVRKMVLKDMDISPCNSCYSCSSGEGCVIRDDMDIIYRGIVDSDIIILASPIYFAGVSAVAKLMIDRCQAFWSQKYIANIKSSGKKKCGYFIASAGAEGMDVFQPAIATVKLFFAACDAVYCGGLLIPGTDAVPVEGNLRVLEDAYNFGRHISENKI
jgi:multimeric flavodoxin WrbA